MSLVSSIYATLKADTSDFRAKFAEVGDVTEKADSRLKKFGLGFGGVGALAVAFRAVVNHARELTGELDENERRAQNFAKGLDEAKKSMLGVGVSALGVVNGLGEWLGKQAAIAIYGKEQVARNEQIAKQADETIARLAKEKPIIEAVNKIKEQTAAVEKQRTEHANKQLDITEQIAIAEKKVFEAAVARSNAQGDKVKIAQAELEFAKARLDLDKLTGERVKKNAEDEKKIAADREKALEKRQEQEEKLYQLKFDQLKPAEQEAALAKEIKEIEADIKQMKADGVETLSAEIALEETRVKHAKVKKEVDEASKQTLDQQLATLQKQGVSVEQIVAVLRGRGFSEDEILAKLKAQTTEIERQITIQRKGQDYESQSTVALEGVRSRVKSQLDAVRQQNAMVPVNQRNPAQYALESELAQIDRDLAARRNIGSFATKFGEDAARFKYGDTATDRALRAQQEETTKIRVTMEQVLQTIRQSPWFKG